MGQVFAIGKNSAVLKEVEFTTLYGWLVGWVVGWLVGWLVFDPSDFWAKWWHLERAVHFSKKLAICDKKRCAHLSQANLW